MKREGANGLRLILCTFVVRLSKVREMGEDQGVDLLGGQIHKRHGAGRVYLDQVHVAQVATTLDLQVSVQCIHPGKMMLATLACKGAHTAMESLVAVLVVKSSKLTLAVVALVWSQIGVGPDVRVKVVGPGEALGASLIVTLVDALGSAVAALHGSSSGMCWASGGQGTLVYG